MRIESADKVSFDELYDASMDAFSDYVVPAAMTQDQWRGMLVQRGYVPELSYVYVDAGQVQSYWMTGTAPDARPGTGYAISVGTRTSARRGGRSRRLFAQVAETLREHGFTSMLHEVITSNTPAVALYESLGYRPARRVKCFRGEVQDDIDGSPDVTIRETSLDEAERIANLVGGWRPSWQNEFHAMRQGAEDVIAFAAEHDGAVAGYGLLVPDYKQITQIGILPNLRRRSIATSLVTHWRDSYDLKTMAMLNVPDTDQSMLGFFKAMGWQNTIDQFEMALTL